MRKLLSGNLRLHAGQFSEITIPHFLFAGADEVIELGGTFRTWRDARLESVMRTKAGVRRYI
jgi:hypothetical protein